MKAIAGWIVPEMNWAANPASYIFSLVAANFVAASSVRPNTFTSACPVNDSSTCALSAPV